MLCLSQPPDDVVQINVYGATLAGMLNKGVNIPSFLSAHGYPDCVVFDVPRRDAKNRTPYLISSLRDAHLLKSLIEGAEEIKAESSSPPPEVENRRSTGIPAEDPLLNCSLSTIAAETGLLFFSEDDNVEENEMVPSDVRKDLEEREKTLIPSNSGILFGSASGTGQEFGGGGEQQLREVEGENFREEEASGMDSPNVPKPQPYDPLDTKFLDSDDISFGSSVADCMLGLLAQLCPKTSGIGDGGVEEQQLGEVEEDHFIDGDWSATELIKSLGRKEESPEMNGDLGEAIVDPVETPGSTNPDAPIVGGLDAIDLQRSDSTLPATGAAPWSDDDDDDEFFDCSNEYNVEMMVVDLEEDNSDERINDASKQKKDSDIRRSADAERKKYSCQYCKEVLNWKPHYGKSRFLNHVRKHYLYPTFKCQLCSFMADQDHKIRYHHRTAHPGVRYKKAESCETVEDTKKLLKLWHQCFPGFPAPIRFANAGGRSPKRRPLPTT